eukprot:EG_transcript_10018
MAATLPPELLLRVADFAAAPALGRACRRLRALLRHRHLSLSVPYHAALPTLAELSRLPALPHIVGLTVVAPHLSGIGLGVVSLLLQTLEQTTALRCLRLDLSNCALPAYALDPLISQILLLPIETIALDFSGNPSISGAWASELPVLPGLRSLSLNLAGTWVGPSQLADALVATTSVQAVSLEFAPLDVADCGLEALETLRHMESLTALSLQLPQCVTTQDACETLASLRRCPALWRLELQLHGSRPPTAGLRALGTLADAPGLRRLRLGLAECGIDCEGAAAVAAALVNSPGLESLWLDLTHNTVGATGTQALASLAVIPTLRNLCIQLANNPINAVESTARRHVTHLESLELDLSGNYRALGS